MPGEIRLPPEPAPPTVLQISPSIRIRPLATSRSACGIDAVFDLEDALGQRLGRVVIADRDRALHQDRTGVGFRNDEMHRRARDLDAGAQRLRLGFEAGKRRQQRGMNVEHPAVPALHEFGGEQAHEPAEANQLDPVLVERRLQYRLEGGAILAERLAFDGERRNPQAAAFSSPPASARLEITSAISAGKS